MNPVTDWMPAPVPLYLRKESVHVWRASLDVPTDSLQGLRALLNSEESLRAGRFVQRRDNHHFTVGRAVLRLLLGRYLQCSPAAVSLETHQFGKLALAAPIAEPPLHFNLSHSHGLAIYAFTIGRELGVDTEWHRREFASEEIANRFFSIREREELRALPPAARVEGFFNAWTRKESYVKAHGKGLQIPLDSFDVTLTPNEPVILRSIDSDRWRIHSFTPAEDFAAAVTIAAGDTSLDFYDADSLVK